MIAHCTKCHHEWQTLLSADGPGICDWCGAPGMKIAADWVDYWPCINGCGCPPLSDPGPYHMHDGCRVLHEGERCAAPPNADRDGTTRLVP